MNTAQLFAIGIIAGSVILAGLSLSRNRERHEVITVNLPCDHKLVSAVYEDGKVNSSIRARRPGEPMVKNTLILTFVDGTTKGQAFLIESVCRS